MPTYYEQLGVHPEASDAELEKAYRLQIERYDPARVAEIDPEMRRVAEQRTAEFARIYELLRDSRRRRQYDASIGLAAAEGQAPSRRQKLSTRERLFVMGGAIAAITLVAIIWVLTGRSETESVAMGETDRPAPAIALPMLGGGQVSLEAYRGQVVLVNFWGTWCEPCRKEMPALQTAYEQLGPQGFTVIGVNLAKDERTYGNSETDVQAFITQYGVTYPIALDQEGSVTNAYRVFPLPTSFFVDPSGNIRYVRVGELTVDDVIARFNQLKQEAAALRR